MEKWTQQFSEMGSRNKKTGKLNYGKRIKFRI